MTIFEANIHILSQLSEQLSKLPKERYSEPLELLSNSSIGQHTRHILEYFECLLEQFPGGIIAYDKRRRDHLTETDLGAALQKIESLNTALSTIPEENPSLELHIFFTGNTEEKPQIQPTNFYRELTYTFEHALHHIAILKIAIKHEFPGVGVLPDLGVAPATIRHRRKEEAPETLKA